MQTCHIDSIVWSGFLCHNTQKLTWILRQMCPTVPGPLPRRPSSSLPATLASQETPDSLPEPRETGWLEHLTDTWTPETACCYRRDFLDLDSQGVQDVGVQKILQGGVSAIHIVTGGEERMSDLSWLIQNSDDYGVWVILLAQLTGARCRRPLPRLHSAETYQHTRQNVRSRGFNGHWRHVCRVPHLIECALEQQQTKLAL